MSCPPGPRVRQFQGSTRHAAGSRTGSSLFTGSYRQISFRGGFLLRWRVTLRRRRLRGRRLACVPVRSPLLGGISFLRVLRCFQFPGFASRHAYVFSAGAEAMAPAGSPIRRIHGSSGVCANRGLSQPRRPSSAVSGIHRVPLTIFSSEMVRCKTYTRRRRRRLIRCRRAADEVGQMRTACRSQGGGATLETGLFCAPGARRKAW